MLALDGVIQLTERDECGYQVGITQQNSFLARSARPYVRTGRLTVSAPATRLRHRRR